MLVNYDVESRRMSKMKSDNRVLVLRPMEGKKSLAADGSVDARLFTGENKLHAQYSDVTGMWSLHYDIGGLPGALKNQFTMFSELLAHTRAYFARRNVEIVEVQE